MKNKLQAWKFLYIALWGYSTIMSLIFVLMSIIPAEETYYGTDYTGGALILAPILIFLVVTLIRFKQFKWNWWKVILGIYSLVFSLLLTFAMFLPPPNVTDSSGSITAVLLFLPIFIYCLYLDVLESHE